MRASFVLSEIGIGLRRNFTMTVAVVVTVAISLALFGAGLLIREQVGTMKDYWYDKVEVSVYLCGEGSGSSSPNCNGQAVTDEQRTQLQEDLQATPLVEKVYYESKQDAYKRFKEQFKESPDLVQNVTPDALPESFRVKLKDPTQFEVVASAFRDRPGVDEVQDQKALLENFFKLLNTLQLFALIIAGVQIFAATLLISNTIRVAAFSRRRETGIMRLVGASNLYIQLPFLLEGVLAGLVGAAFASGAVIALKAILIDRLLKPNFPITAYIGWDAVLSVLPLLFLTGMALSGLASFITLRRHLRV